MPGIIVGVDGSGHSQQALRWAIQEALVRRAPLTVLTVHQTIIGWAGGPVSYPGDKTATEQARKAAQDETDTVLEELAGQHPDSVTVEAVSGIPAQALLNAADNANADMIVVGSRGAGGFASLLMGSVSTQVAQHAHCPVVVIPADERELHRVLTMFAGQRSAVPPLITQSACPPSACRSRA
jgi:nucleotide-binding universal stress UspA family protein